MDDGATGRRVRRHLWLLAGRGRPGALDGTVPGVGFTIDQRFLTLTTLYVLIPALMVAGSVLLPRFIARPASIVLAGLYAVSIVVSCIGETWVHYLLGSAIEVALLVLIGVHASRWGTGVAATTESQS